MASSFMPALNRRRGFAYSCVFVLLLSLAVLSCGRSGGRPAPSPSPDAAPPASSPVEIARDLGIPDAEDLSRKDAKLAAMDYDTRLDRLTDRFFEEIMRIYGTPEKGKVRLPASLARDPYFANSERFDLSPVSTAYAGGERMASIAPREGFGIVSDLAASAAAETGKISLSWTYANKGDYNQDGEVGISDVTPIALNFGALTNDGTNDDAERVVDGSGSGEVWIDDVTPIALNYLAMVQSYTIEFLPPGDTVWQSVPTESRVMFASATLPPSGGFKTFSVTLGDGEGGVLPPVLDGTKFRVAPLDSLGAQGEYSNEAIFNTGTGNVPPVARGSATPEQGTAPLTVTFEGDASYDTDGQIVKYEWDFFGTGDFADYTGTFGIAFADYSSPGRYNAVLRVTDDGGAIGQKIFSIFVNAPGGIAPIISATASPDEGEAPFTANFVIGATDIDGTIVSYEWDFGDGIFRDFTPTKGAASRLFTQSNVGSFNCIARVTDNSFMSATRSVSVRVYPPGGGPVEQWPPKAEARAWPNIGDAPLEVALGCNLSYDPDGEIVSYEWDFDGNGTFDWQSSVPTNLTRTYEAGYWRAKLRVVDDTGLWNESTVTIVADSPNLYWQKQTVQEIYKGSGFDVSTLLKNWGLGMEVAVSPATGEICVIYRVTDVSFPYSEHRERIRLAWKQISAGQPWRFEDFYIDVPENQYGMPTRPIFQADGTLLFGSYIESSSPWNQAIIVKRTPEGEFETVYAGGFMNDIYYQSGWLAASDSGKIAFIYRNGSDGDEYNLAELEGTAVSQSNPFASSPAAMIRCYGIEYRGDEPILLADEDRNLCFYSRPEAEFLREVVIIQSGDDSLLTYVNDTPGIHIRPASELLRRYFLEGNSWKAHNLALNEGDNLQSPMRVAELGQNWCYLAPWSAPDGLKPAFLFDYGGGYLLEAVDSNMADFEIFAIAASEDKIYVAGGNSVDLRVVLCTRDAPL
ncbi:MAG: hypothetical protein HRF49_07315 [bacterium]|jgi:PKD repeat protein